MDRDRAEFIGGLRELALRLERHPDAPLPIEAHDGLYVYTVGLDEFAAAGRCYGGQRQLDAKGYLVLRDGVPGLRLRVKDLSGEAR